MATKCNATTRRRNNTSSVSDRRTSGSRPDTELILTIKTYTIMTTRKNKYCYGWNIYTNYGYGWEVEATYDKKETTYAQVKKDAQEYRIAGARVRISNTRWLNND